jgi:hemoglobin-like flavoprotein
MAGEAVMESLEQVSERCADPTGAVYAKLFEQHPEMKPLFVLDKDDAAKGHMLHEVLENLIDFTGERHIAPHFIRSELVNHDNLGIAPDVFGTFFPILRDTFKDILGADWTEAMERDWNGLIAEIDEMIREEAGGMAQGARA